MSTESVRKLVLTPLFVNYLYMHWFIISGSFRFRWFSSTSIYSAVQTSRCVFLDAVVGKVCKSSETAEVMLVSKESRATRDTKIRFRCNAIHSIASARRTDVRDVVPMCLLVRLLHDRLATSQHVPTADSFSGDQSGLEDFQRGSSFHLSLVFLIFEFY